GQVEVLDLFGFGLVAHPDEDLVVEVDPAGAHAADVQGQRGPDLVGGALEVVRQLGRDGWLALGWPAEYGGRGGLGIDMSYPVHRYFVAAKGNEFALGGATAQLLRIGV